MVRVHEAVVVGGGLTGLGAAHALARAGVDTLHLAPKGRPDARTSALMMPSVQYLAEAGLLADPAAIGTALEAIRIIDATDRLVRAPETLFEAREAGLEAFGWNLPNARLAEAFEAAGRALPGLTTLDIGMSAMAAGENGSHRLTLGDGSIVEAALVVGADGKGSPVRGAAGLRVRERAFRQAALVCDLTLERPLEGVSVEFHYPDGPFTLVPAGENRANLVWIDLPERLEAARGAGEAGFAAALMAKSKGLFGALKPVTGAFVFPLSTLGVDLAGRDGVVLVGESAHAFPPIGAQGLNLGLRDVADLARVIALEGGRQEGWAERVSADYARSRAPDLLRTGAMVDGLFRSLLSEMLPAQTARAGGLWALKLLPGLRRRAFGLGMGATGR
ncbi:FAD-dependent monooxygenase [Arsenicitalea aurantiaca]|nr:FAD-dependent monooxygenase [Arsenicitalea aurantiaca]